MFYLADRLMESNSLDKAANVLLNVAKLSGYLDSTTNVNVFGELTQADLATMKARLKAVTREAVN